MNKNLWGREEKSKGEIVRQRKRKGKRKGKRKRRKGKRKRKRKEEVPSFGDFGGREGGVVPHF